MVSREEVLKELNSKHGNNVDAVVPSLGFGYFQYVGGRLSAFADTERWCLLLETFGWDPYVGRTNHAQIGSHLHPYGTAVYDQVKPMSTPWNRQVLQVTRDGPGNATFDGLELNRNATGFYVRDSFVSVENVDEQIVREGVVLDKPPNVFVYELLRALYPQIQSECFATADELRQCLGLELEPLVQLYEWQHPDTWNDEEVMSSPSFEMLVDVIVAQDADKYDHNRVRINTHWSNWTSLCI